MNRNMPSIMDLRKDVGVDNSEGGSGGRDNEQRRRQAVEKTETTSSKRQ